jgi:hypothetical protein
MQRGNGWLSMAFLPTVVTAGEAIKKIDVEG